MIYHNFDDAITAKHGIVLENWPLAKFCNPSQIGSRNEIDIVYQAFRSGTARFRKLSNEEWEKWSETRFQAALNTMGGPGDDDNTSDVTVVSIGEVNPTMTETRSSDGSVTNSSTSPTTLTMTGSEISHPAGPTPATPPLDPDEPVPSAAARTENTSILERRTRSYDDSLDADAASPRKRCKTAAQPLQNFVNAVSKLDGSGLMVPKRTRKERKDKGVKRGPRGGGTRKENAPTSAGPSQSST